MTASPPRRTRLPFALAVACAAVATIHAQTPQVPARAPAPVQPSATEQTPVFRAGVELLPLDAVVLDRDGRQVTDITAADRKSVV